MNKSIFGVFSLCVIGITTGQLFPIPTPKLKLDLGPAHFQLGQDKGKQTEDNMGKDIVSPLPSNTTDPNKMETNPLCNCPNTENSTKDKMEHVTSHIGGVDAISLDAIYKREFQLMEMQEKMWHELKRIADLVYAVQWGTRVIEVESN